MTAEIVLAGLCIALELGLLGLLWRVGKLLDGVETAQARAAAQGREQALRLAALDRLRTGQQIAEQAIGTGANLAREVHLGIASIPFSILENIPPTAPTARVVRKLHDTISRDIYDALGDLNESVGRRLRGAARLPGNDRKKDDD